MRTSSEIKEGWKPTDEFALIVAVMEDGSRREYKRLNVGDVFQALWVDRGVIVNPLEEPNVEGPDVWAGGVDEALQGVNGRDGFGVEVEIGTLAEVTARSRDLKVRN